MSLCTLSLSFDMSVYRIFLKNVQNLTCANCEAVTDLMFRVPVLFAPVEDNPSPHNEEAPSFGQMYRFNFPNWLMSC